MKTIFPWLLAILLAGSLFFVFQNGREKEARLAELQKQVGELTTLQAEVEELRQSQISSNELARLRSEAAQVLKLRNENTQLKRENATFNARKLRAEELQVETQLTPERIAQLVRENEQLRNEVQEFQIVRQREAEQGAINNPVNTCINNLRQLDGATDQWAIENKKATGDFVTAKDIEPYLKKFPMCPSGGAYTIGPVGTSPTCTMPGHALPQ